MSECLFAERGHTFYGDVDDLVTPSELFDGEEAEEAIAAVERVLTLYRGLVAAYAPSRPSRTGCARAQPASPLRRLAARVARLHVKIHCSP